MPRSCAVILRSHISAVLSLCREQSTASFLVIGDGACNPDMQTTHPGETRKLKPPPALAARASLREQPRHQPAGEHAGDAPAIMAGGERRLHRHDLVAYQFVETLEHARVE